MSQSKVGKGSGKDARPSRAKPELTEADKRLLEAEPDWDRTGELAKRLLNTPPNREAVGKAVASKRKPLRGASDS